MRAAVNADSRRLWLVLAPICFPEFLGHEPRADYGEFLAPVKAAEDADNLALFVVNRTAGKAVARAESSPTNIRRLSG